MQSAIGCIFSNPGDRAAHEFWNGLLQGRVPRRGQFHYVVTVERFDEFIGWLQMKYTPRYYMTDCASKNDERYYVAPSGHLEKS